jgi:hypothetical protein
MELALAKLPTLGGLKAALVQKVEGTLATVYVSGLGSVHAVGVSWAQADLRVGDVIYTAGSSCRTI